MDDVLNHVGLVAQVILKHSHIVQSGCREWINPRIGRDGKKTYAQIYLHGRTWLAHRCSWAIANGSDPGAMLVMHECDNPPCVLPKHLFTGTSQDNAMDAVIKGRHGGIVLTYAMLDTARRLRLDGAPYNGIAEQLGVNTVTIWKALTGKTWNHG